MTETMFAQIVLKTTMPYVPIAKHYIILVIMTNVPIVVVAKLKPMSLNKDAKKEDKKN